MLCTIKNVSKFFYQSSNANITKNGGVMVRVITMTGVDELMAGVISEIVTRVMSALVE